MNILESIDGWQGSTKTIYSGSATSRADGVSVYGQSIPEVHDGHGKLGEVFGTNKALELAANFGLEVVGNHVIWERPVSFEALKDFFDEVCLV